MPQPLMLLQPQYVADFHCLGTRCEDTCCAGWGVVIDKETYDKYQDCPDPELKTLMGRTVLPMLVSDGSAPRAATYAQVTMTRANACPFLTDERLCAIQTRLGEDYLSRTCATFPRAMNVVDGVLEQSLSLSCPEAARLALLDPARMRFVTPPARQTPPDQVPTLDSAGPDHGGKPYRHFGAVRAFLLPLLQDRDYPLWERLVVLGMFCEQLDQIVPDVKGEEVPALIASFTQHHGTSPFREALASVTAQPQAQASFLLKAMDFRLGSGPTSVRFIDCYWEFREGIGYGPDATDAEAAAGYDAARADHYRPFMDRHAHILEHYVVGYVFRTLFPFGPQTSLYFEPKSVYAEFVLLAVHYALVRSLLVGMAGYHKDAFGVEHVLRGIQSFAKTVEHDLPCLKSITNSLTDHGLSSLASLAVLIKD